MKGQFEANCVEGSQPLATCTLFGLGVAASFPRGIPWHPRLGIFRSIKGHCGGVSGQRQCHIVHTQRKSLFAHPTLASVVLPTRSGKGKQTGGGRRDNEKWRGREGGRQKRGGKVKCVSLCHHQANWESHSYFLWLRTKHKHSCKFWSCSDIFVSLYWRFDSMKHNYRVVELIKVKIRTVQPCTLKVWRQLI